MKTHTPKTIKEYNSIIKNAVSKRCVYHIQNADGNAILMSEEEYESLKETLELLSVPGFRKSIA